LKFGAAPGGKLDIRNYQRFRLQQGVTILTAVKETIGNFVIPASTADLISLPDGCVATVTGSGSLKFSGTANLWAVTNPLASLELPSPLPTPSVTSGGSVGIGTSLELRCTFQISAQKLPSGRVRLGWHRERASDISVNVTASEGLSAGFDGTDLFSQIVSAISSDASVDLAELRKAGLPASDIQAIQDAVEASVKRKLELAVTSEIGATETNSALFLYDIEIAALTAESRDAVDRALRGDLSPLHAGPLPGVTAVRSVWDRVRSQRVRLEVNLLGVLNFGMISKLTTSGEVLVEPSTGALVITDKVTAERIRSTAVNFGADAQKLRHLMAESFLITAVYQGLAGHVGAPDLTCGHDFFDLENRARRDWMVHALRVGNALGLFPGDAALPGEVEDFGRTMIHAHAEYDSRLAETLFLDASGAPMPQEFYEQAGRDAILAVVREGDADAIRRQPCLNAGLWTRMAAKGQPGFAAIFPNVPAPLVGAIAADYSAIVWWSSAMAGAGQRLAAIRKWLGQHPAASSNDPEFQSLRADLTGHLKKATATTHEQFGQPWGLIAMDRASRQRAAATILITGPKMVRAGQRAVAAAGQP
jgi:hypothetical protein